MGNFDGRDSDAERDGDEQTALDELEFDECVFELWRRWGRERVAHSSRRDGVYCVVGVVVFVETDLYFYIHHF